MITEWLVTLGASFAAWVAGLFPSWSMDKIDAVGVMSYIGGLVSSLGSWVPIGVLAVCSGIVIVAWVAMIGIKIVRALLAHIPGIGGAGD